MIQRCLNELGLMKILPTALQRQAVANQLTATAVTIVLLLEDRVARLHELYYDGRFFWDDIAPSKSFREIQTQLDGYGRKIQENEYKAYVAKSWLSIKINLESG